MKLRTLTRLLPVLMALVLLAAACGRGDDDSDGDAGAGGGNGEPAAGPGFDGSTITLGVITPLTGGVAVIGEPLTNGNEVYFDALNAAGGIAGEYEVKLDIADSEYKAAVATQQYNRMKDEVVLITQLLGTAITSSLVDSLEKDGLVAAPASLDALWVREPNLLPVGGPYQLQAINSIIWHYEENGGEGKRLCALSQDDAFGTAGVEGVQVAADHLGIEIESNPTFKVTGEIKAQVGQLQRDDCEVVFFVGTLFDTGKVLTEAAARRYEPTWIGQSPSWTSALLTGELRDYVRDHFLLAADAGPTWGDTSVEGMEQMLEDQERHAPDQVPDTYFVFGYYQAWAVAQVLEKAVERGDLSQAGIKEAMEEIDVLRFDDLTGDYRYGPADEREPPRANTVYRPDPSSVEENGGLVAEKASFTTEPAETFEFE